MLSPSLPTCTGLRREGDPAPSAGGDAHVSAALPRTGRVKHRFSVSLLHGRVSQLTQTQRRAAHLQPFELKMSVKRGAQVQTTSVRAEACSARACARKCFPHVDKRGRASSPRHVCGPHSERLATPATIFLPLLHLHPFTEATLTSSAGIYIYMYICMYRFTG